ncbi:hypothetical protein IGI04_008389, partial [Brassica rapa subsp. trilocularis]
SKGVNFKDVFGCPFYIFSEVLTKHYDPERSAGEERARFKIVTSDIEEDRVVALIPSTDGATFRALRVFAYCNEASPPSLAFHVMRRTQLGHYMSHSEIVNVRVSDASDSAEFVAFDTVIS